MKETLFVTPVHRLESREVGSLTVFASSTQDALTKVERALCGTGKFVITNEIASTEQSADDFEI